MDKKWREIDFLEDVREICLKRKTVPVRMVKRLLKMYSKLEIECLDYLFDIEILEKEVKKPIDSAARDNAHYGKRPYKFPFGHKMIFEQTALALPLSAGG